MLRAFNQEILNATRGIFNYDGSAKYQLNLGATNSGALVAAWGVKYLDRKWCVMKPSAKLDDP